MNSILGAAKAALVRNPSPANNDAFAKALSTVVKDGEWVHIPTNADNSLVIINKNYSNYIAFFSDEEEIRRNEAPYILVADINKIIDTLYSAPQLTGLVVDPYTSPIWVSRKQLSMVTCRKDPRLEKKDWGKGIPNYSQDDLMVEEELQDFAMEVVHSYGIKPLGYKVREVNTSADYAPNFVLEKDGQIFYVIVEVAVAPRVPILNDRLRKSFVENTRQNNAVPLFAPVSIGSRDGVRFDASLALCGDEFLVKFEGFEEL